MVEVINEDYSDYVSLSSKLANVDGAVLRMRKPLLELKVCVYGVGGTGLCLQLHMCVYVGTRYVDVGVCLWVLHKRKPLLEVCVRVCVCARALCTRARVLVLHACMQACCLGTL